MNLNTLVELLKVMQSPNRDNYVEIRITSKEGTHQIPTTITGINKQNDNIVIHAKELSL